MNITSQPCTQLQLVLQVLQSCFQILNHAFKASGPDDIPAYLLKEIAFQIAPSLAMVFQVSLNQCKLAADWKVAHMIPVFKKGDKSSPHNYRPISLTCLCYKILEHIVYSNIFTHLNQANILCEEQHGFRERRCCESQLILTIDNFAQCLNNKGLVHAIFLDFAKAFDKVPHKKLCHKLASGTSSGVDFRFPFQQNTESFGGWPNQ